MRFFVQATIAPQPKTKNTVVVATFFATLLTVMAVAQLFTFERFPSVLETVVGDGTFAQLLAALVVTIEIAAIPFLLRLRLSPAARFVSMAAGWISALFWVVISVFASSMFGMYDNAGFLGDTIALPGGWWAVFFSLGLAVLAAWASWGMWPFSGRKSR